MPEVDGHQGGEQHARVGHDAHRAQQRRNPQQQKQWAGHRARPQRCDGQRHRKHDEQRQQPGAHPDHRRERVEHKGQDAVGIAQVEHQQQHGEKAQGRGTVEGGLHRSGGPLAGGALARHVPQAGGKAHEEGTAAGAGRKQVRNYVPAEDHLPPPVAEQPRRPPLPSHKQWGQYSTIVIVE